MCGYVNDKNKLERFFKEFFHPDRSLDADCRAIVLCPYEPSEDVRSLLVSPVFDSRVVFMVGSALSAGKCSVSVVLVLLFSVVYLYNYYH